MDHLTRAILDIERKIERQQEALNHSQATLASLKEYANAKTQPKQEKVR